MLNKPRPKVATITVYKYIAIHIYMYVHISANRSNTKIVRKFMQQNIIKKTMIRISSV